ncbi:glycosyltransferase family 2 protein [Zhongshania aliphaticivorans]|uniref:glycosyltransferase family 2 protein n=1 Tax=Zhongshania aliphaticivorans TaxID=1470434 RepID=UPI0012E67BF2|nr:glycosyltransferase family 2 protein [Zhongshania aliphaticivorans]CAA0096329.1 Undecaprenyl-phosphate 4-deoxy-4-formamido-L-arabinose transferase [Zhongshania aliphaticivorans]
MNFSVVLPAKNEAATVGVVVKAIRARYPRSEVIVVNDGSDDDTQTLAEAAGAKVVNHPYSKGNGASIKSGARAASGDVIVFMDADGQHNPDDIEALLAGIDEGYDLVVGARQSGSQASVGRGVANGFYNKLASYMTGHKVEDLTSGFRAVRASKFKEFLYLLPNGFSYPTTSTMAFFRAGYSVKYVPIHAAQREGKSHIKPLKDGMRFLLIIFKIGTLYSPLKLFTPAAVIFFLMGLGWYGYTFVTVERFTNMSALLFTGAVVIFMMGLISEQITALMYKKE